jgi:hypothetical protein
VYVDVERDEDFGHALEKGVVLDGADLGDGAKLGEALLSNGSERVPTQDIGSDTAVRRAARDR